MAEEHVDLDAIVEAAKVQIHIWFITLMMSFLLLVKVNPEGPKLIVFKSNGSILALLSPQTKLTSRANPYNRCVRWLSEYTIVHFEGNGDLPIDVDQYKGHTFFYRGDIKGNFKNLKWQLIHFDII